MNYITKLWKLKICFKMKHQSNCFLILDFANFICILNMLEEEQSNCKFADFFSNKNIDQHFNCFQTHAVTVNTRLYLNICMPMTVNMDKEETNQHWIRVCLFVYVHICTFWGCVSFSLVYIEKEPNKWHRCFSICTWGYRLYFTGGEAFSSIYFNVDQLQLHRIDRIIMILTSGHTHKIERQS